jgi:hypothetical protein
MGFMYSAKFRILLRLHGVRLDLRLKPFIAERFLPSSVLGPELNPPWNLQRPLLYRLVSLQGVPALVFAPQVKSLSSSGNGGAFTNGGGYTGVFLRKLNPRLSCHSALMRAHSFFYHFSYSFWIRSHCFQ